MMPTRTPTLCSSNGANMGDNDTNTNDSICYWGILGALVIGFFMGWYMGAGIQWQTL